MDCTDNTDGFMNSLIYIPPDYVTFPAQGAWALLFDANQPIVMPFVSLLAFIVALFMFFRSRTGCEGDEISGEPTPHEDLNNDEASHSSSSAGPYGCQAGAKRDGG